MKVLSIGVLVLLSASAFAQDETDSLQVRKAHYMNQFLGGGLIGDQDHGSALSMAMFHGVRYKKMGLLLGVSYDEYREWKVIPLMASFQIDLGRNPSRNVFWHATGGHSFTRHLERNNDYLAIRENGGRMFQTGLGYRIEAGKYRMYVLAGYRFQRIFYEQGPRWVMWSDPSINTPMDRVRRDMNRLVVQFGFGIN